MTVNQKQDWDKLGILLRRRRVDLGFPNRSAFARHHGLNSGQHRTIADMENCTRSNFERGTFDLVEHLYRWQPGSILQVLGGGDPMPEDDDLDIRDERPTARAAALAELRQLIERVPDTDIPRVRDYLLGVVDKS